MSSMSTKHIVKLMVAIFVTLSSIAPAASYDCRRDGQVCFNNGMCQSNGTCLCTADYDGYNCRIPKSLLAANTCTPPCQNSGVCANNTCYCTEKYYGMDCKNKREQILCFGGQKAIHINPEGFQGTIYISGNRGKQNCTFKNVSDVAPTLPQNVSWSEGFAILIPDNSPDCGAITERTSGTVVIEERYSNIEYAQQIVTTLDERLTTTCEFDNNTVRTLYGDVMSSSVTSAQYTNTSITNIYEPVVFKVSSNNQSLPSTPMLIGMDLTFTFNIPAETGYDSVIVMGFTANDTKTSGQTFTIIDAKCPGPNAASVLSAFERSPDNRTVTVQVKVFKFVDSDSVGFTGTARICKTGDAACDIATCSGETPPAGVGRRKRETGNQMTMQTVVRVTEDPQAAAASGQSPTDSKPSDECKNDSSRQEGDIECLMKKEIIVVLAIMAAAVIILMIACIVMTCKLLKTGTKVVDVPQSEYQASMSLPRLSPANF